MRALLQQSGFHISGSRADCIHCEGGSRLTISFTDEVAFCHRCKWTANKTTLARGLGKEVTPETEAHRLARAKAEKFDAWLNESYKQVAAEYRYLGRMAAIAKDVLAKYPDCEPAWDALANFCHREAELAGALDTLCFEKVSVWNERRLTPLELFDRVRGNNGF
jgi:hypothetical protein